MQLGIWVNALLSQDINQERNLNGVKPSACGRHTVNHNIVIVYSGQSESTRNSERTIATSIIDVFDVDLVQQFTNAIFKRGFVYTKQYIFAINSV